MPASFSDNLFEALEKIDRPGSFCVGGICASVLPGLEVGKLGTVGLPLTTQDAKRLREHCEQAPYGKGEATIVDTKVRRVWQLLPDRFRLANPAWKELLNGALREVEKELGLENWKLEAHLYNLLLYEPGCFFLPHRDGEKLDRMVATLVIGLPSSHEGGELVVRHEGEEKVIDFTQGKESRFQTHFAAFYADCEHEIRPVRKGYRLCLVYNLTLAKGQKGLAAPRSGEHIARVAGILRDWPAGEPVKLAITLEHEYTKDGLDWTALKGLDQARAQVLKEAARQAGCKCYLALLTYHESGTAEGGEDWGYSRRGYYDDYEPDVSSNYEMGEIYETGLSAEQWQDADGKRVPFEEIKVDQDEVVPKDSLTDVDPEEDFEGYTGNAGMTLDRWYRHAAVFLWPEKRHFQVLCGSGTENALAGLTTLAGKLRTVGRKSAAVLKDQCRDFAGTIISKWQPRQSYPGTTRESRAADLAKVLALLADAELIKAFLGKVVADDASVELSSGFLKACDKLGWANFSAEFAKVFSSTNVGSLAARALLLEQLSSTGSKQREWADLAEAAARALLDALVSIDQKKPSSLWYDENLKRSDVLARLARSFIAIEQGEMLDRLVAHVRTVPDKYPPAVQIQAFCALQPWLAKYRKKAGGVLTRWVAGCREHLRSATKEAPQKPADYRRDAKIPCKCADCAELIRFLNDPAAKVLRFPAGKQRRKHLHQIINHHHCELTHVTDHGGSPETLVCTKTLASFQSTLKTYRQNLKELATLEKLLASLRKD